MPEWATGLLGYGPLGIFAVFAGWMMWKLGNRYIVSAEALHKSLQEAETVQRDLCKAHTDTMGQLVDIMKVTLGKDVARDEKIDLLLDTQQEQATLTSTGVAMLSIERLRLAALEACQLCRKMHTPDVGDAAGLVAEHCKEIERILDSSK